MTRNPAEAEASKAAGFVTSFDGTRLAVRSRGSGGEVPVLVVNGIGARAAVLDPVSSLLAETRPVAAWDYRGLHHSAPPATDRLEPGAHAEDAIAALDHLGFDQAVVLAWSTGGRIGLEIAHRYPHRVAALVMVCAGYGHPLRRALRLEASSLLPALAGVAKHFAGPLNRWLAGFVVKPEIAGLIRQSGMIGPTADVPRLVAHLEEIASCDTRRLLAIFEAVVGDNGEPLLPGIEVPALLVAGGRDVWTPVALVRDAAAKMPGARVQEYESGTHFIPVEHPERLARDIDDFLRHGANP